MIPGTDEGHPGAAPATAAFVIGPESRETRRAVGALAWCCLEELSLGASRTADGWIAAVGVRAVGAALGVTKDTAARAIQTLISAGLVARCGSASHAEYSLCLPSGVRICLDRQDADERPGGKGADERRGCKDADPSIQDDAHLPSEIDACPAVADTSPPTVKTSSARAHGPRPATPEVCSPDSKHSRKAHKRAVPQAAGQGSLFGDSSAERCEVCGLSTPDWPARWLRTDDGRSFCPDHKGETRFLR